jgi:hypothetical protein
MKALCVCSSLGNSYRYGFLTRLIDQKIRTFMLLRDCSCSPAIYGFCKTCSITLASRSSDFYSLNDSREKGLLRRSQRHNEILMLQEIQHQQSSSYRFGARGFLAPPPAAQGRSDLRLPIPICHDQIIFCMLSIYCIRLRLC